jgi:hypothetical protein
LPLSKELVNSGCHLLPLHLCQIARSERFNFLDKGGARPNRFFTSLGSLLAELFDLLLDGCAESGDARAQGSKVTNTDALVYLLYTRFKNAKGLSSGLIDRVGVR